jgi:hypothetical protein
MSATQHVPALSNVEAQRVLAVIDHLVRDLDLAFLVPAKVTSSPSFDVATFSSSDSLKCLRKQHELETCLRAAFPPYFPACAARSPNGRLFLPPSLIQAAPFLPLLPRWAPPLRMLPLTSPPLTRVVTHCPCQSAYIRSCVTCRAFASYSDCRYPFDHHSVLSAYDTGSVRRGFQVHVAFLNSQPWLRRAAGVQAGLCVVPRS